MTDILCEIKCKSSIFVYISVASKTGHVAISFLQMDMFADAIENSPQFGGFTMFKVYRKNNNEEVQQQQYFNEEVQEQQCFN
jgi:hypothetical protein